MPGIDKKESIISKHLNLMAETIWKSLKINAVIAFIITQNKAIKAERLRA